MQEMQETRVRSLGREDPLEEGMASHGESPGQRSLVGYSPWGHEESDMTERLSMHSRRCLWYKRTLLPVLIAGPAVLFSGCVCVWFLFKMALYWLSLCWNFIVLVSLGFLSLLSFRRQWHPTPVLLPGKSHGWRSLVGCSPWGSLRVRHDWVTSVWLFTFMHWRRKWQPTPVFLPRESQGRRSLVGYSPWGWQSWMWLSMHAHVKIILRECIQYVCKL